jgi:hypothetical protein
MIVLYQAREPRCGVSRRTVPAKAASEEKDMEAKLRQVPEAAYPGEEARYFLPMSIGSAPETADEGAVLILNGTKTLTSSPFWDYPDGKISPPIAIADTLRRSSSSTTKRPV